MSATQMLLSGRGLGLISGPTQTTLHKGLSALRPSGLPPNLTNPLNTLVAPSPARYQNNLAMAGLQQLPESFDWREEAKRRNIRLESVKNQKSCGNCWAMATASTLSDRYNVSGNPTPDLSPLYMIACDKNDSACDGGNTQIAARFCETKGIAANNCANWEDWCNSHECSEAVRNVPCDFGNCNVWHAKNKSTHTIKGNPLESPITPTLQPIVLQARQGSLGVGAKFTRDPASVQNQLKAEILANGPVLTSFWVFPDFMDQSLTPWSSTNNIYIHGAYGDTHQGYAGGHAVEIIGWGKGNAGKYGELSYWIVKNSWGPEWNNGGYFKFAMSQYKNKTGNSITDVTINGYTGLDVPLECSIQEKTLPFGGSVVFLPDATRKNNPSNWGGDNNGSESSSDSFKDWLNKYWWAVLLLVLLIVVVVAIAI